MRLRIALSLVGILATATPPATARGQVAGEVAVFAGGCFWGVQGVFQHVRGFTGAVAGYAGGASRAGDGAAEAVQVTFDPGEISYAQLLQIFFSVVHDPTQRDRQGPDVGPRYRSAIFPADADQADLALTYIAALNAARIFDDPVATTIEAGATFEAAPPVEQDYLAQHRTDPYIVATALPKLDDLRRSFPELFRAAPVLVGDDR